MPRPAAPLIKQTADRRSRSRQGAAAAASAAQRAGRLRARATTPVPLSERYGLSQRERLQSASEAAYHTALERLFRPRLLYRLEEQLDARIAEPAFVYEALKVYLMLGGQQPPDRELIKSWMQRDWADNLYPGATNAEGRRLLEEHLAAMFDLETEQPPLVELDGRLIEEAQKTLARLSVAQRAYELLKSEARALDRRRLDRGAQGRAGRVRSCSRARRGSRSTPSACRPSSPITASSRCSSPSSADCRSG